jgi:ribonuclease III
MRDFKRLEKRMRVVFENKDLLRQAFVHRSYLNEHPAFKLPHNERLEFLGDAVLELAVTEYLYKNYPNPEGELTNWRAALVKGKTISKVARRLDFNDYLYLSRGEAKSTGRARDLILANTFEAVVGAIYLDKNLKIAQKFIEIDLIKELPEILEKKLYTDPKSRFQELAQEKLRVTPCYKVLKEEGPDHNKIFTVGVYLVDKLVGQGQGPSKQAAELGAASDALVSYKF